MNRNQFHLLTFKFLFSIFISIVLSVDEDNVHNRDCQIRLLLSSVCCCKLGLLSIIKNLFPIGKRLMRPKPRLPPVCEREYFTVRRKRSNCFARRGNLYFVCKKLLNPVLTSIGHREAFKRLTKVTLLGGGGGVDHESYIFC